MTKIGEIPEELEDYLEIIFYLGGQKKSVSKQDIVAQNGLAAPEVDTIIQTLQQDGFIQESAQEIKLTPKGEDLAGRLVLRHEFLARYLTEMLYVSPAVAEKDAHAIMHHLSLETIDRMVAFFEYLRVCPNASPELIKNFGNCCILKRDNEESTCANRDHCPLAGRLKKARSLIDLKPGEKGHVLRVIARGAIRRRLIDMGVLPDVEVEMQSVAPLGGTIKIKMKGYHLTLRKKEAEGILLRRWN